MNTKQLIYLACGLPVVSAAAFTVFALQGSAPAPAPVERRSTGIVWKAAKPTSHPNARLASATFAATAKAPIAIKTAAPVNIPVPIASWNLANQPIALFDPTNETDNATTTTPAADIAADTNAPRAQNTGEQSGTRSPEATQDVATTQQADVVSPGGSDAASAPSNPSADAPATQPSTAATPSTADSMELSMTPSLPVAESSSASISELEANPNLRFSPTSRPNTPEPQKPPLATEQNVDTNKSFFEWQRATDDWFGLRPKLDDRGISVQGSLSTDAFKNLSGGTDTEGSAVVQLFNLNVTVDTERLFQWKGGTLFTSFQIVGGDSVTDQAGSFLGVTNIESDDRVQLSELWYEQSLFDGKIRAAFGKIDAGAQFAHPGNSDEFLNSASGNGPTVAGLPAYPDPSMGFQLVVEPNDLLYAAAGVFDGALRRGKTTGNLGPDTFHGDDLFLIAEGGLKWNVKNLAGRFVVGGWYHTNDFGKFDGTTTDGDSGPYVLFDQILWKADPENADDARGVGMFAQYGYSDPEINDAEHYFGTGFTWTGPYASRADDSVGVALNYVRFGGRTGSDFSGDEVQVEVFYNFKLTPWLSIKPDIQFISNPGGDAGARDALLGGVRIVADF